MPARIGLALALAFACLLLAPGCAENPYALDAQSAATLVGPRFVQAARPTRCPEDAQPAIIGFHGPEKTPEWGCFLACPTVKQAYVTDVTKVDDSWSLTPTCHFVCDANEHRTAYVGFERKAYCAPGAVTDPEQLATFARELRFQKYEQGERDRRAENVARKKAEDEAREADGRRRQYQAHLSELEDALQAMETTPVPWSFDLVQAHFTFARDLEGIREGMPIDSAVRDSLLERVAALLAQRQQSEKALGVLRPSRELATDRATRIRVCKMSCDDASTPCRRSCASLAPGTCDSCRQVVAQCQDACSRTT